MTSICPQCQSPKVVQGKRFNLLGGGSSFQYFKPKELRLLANANHIAIKRGGFLACTDCGLLWSELNPAALRKLLSENGNKAVKERLGL